MTTVGKCECGHLSGDHTSSGRRSLAGFMRGDFNGGRCLVQGCGCLGFVQAEPDDGSERAAC